MYYGTWSSTSYNLKYIFDSKPSTWFVEFFKWLFSSFKVNVYFDVSVMMSSPGLLSRVNI